MASLLFDVLCRIAPVPTLHVGLHASVLPDATEPIGSAHPFIGNCTLQYFVLINFLYSSFPTSQFHSPNYLFPATLCSRTLVLQHLNDPVPGALSIPSSSSPYSQSCFTAIPLGGSLPPLFLRCNLISSMGVPHERSWWLLIVGTCCCSWPL